MVTIYDLGGHGGAGVVQICQNTSITLDACEVQGAEVRMQCRSFGLEARASLNSKLLPSSEEGPPPRARSAARERAINNFCAQLPVALI